MLRSRRLAFVAAAVVIGLSGCGDAARTTTSGSAPAIIHIGAAGSSTQSAGAPAADKMMMPFTSFNFVVDGTLPDLAATGNAWKLSAGQSVDTARVAKMAKVLGVKGDVRTVPADQGGGWQVGSADYTGASITVGVDGMVSWWFNPDPSTTGSSISAGCASPAEPIAVPDAPVSSGSDSSVTESTIVITPAPCETPAPPVGVPTKAAALAKAKALFADLGYNAADYEFETYADEWGANVTGFLMLDGHRSPISISIGFGAEGAVTWASGSLATPEPAGEYPLVGTAAGLTRLQDGAWMGYYGAPGVMAKGMAADMVGGASTRSVTATPETTVVSSGSSGSGVGAPTVIAPPPVDPPVTCDPAADCVPETYLPPEPITVHLNDARVDLTMVWDVDGTVWLLPAYTFLSTDGGVYTVIAVDDQYVELPDTGVTTEPVPVDTGTGANPGTVDTTPAPVDQAEATKVLTGVAEDEAAKVASEFGWTVRVVKRDGESLMVTEDYSTSRVNVAVEAGVVTSVESIG